MNDQSAINIFEAHGGILRMTQALALGINRRTLYRLRDEGQIERVRTPLAEVTRSGVGSKDDLGEFARASR